MKCWKRVSGYPNYAVSDAGDVVNLRTGKELKQLVNTWGYPRVGLSKAGKAKTIPTHRLVATHFNPAIPGKTCVNHIDGDKTNNNYSNLEWVTPSENSLHATRLGLQDSTHCQRAVIDSEGNEYQSIAAAARALGLYKNSVDQSLKFGSVVGPKKLKFFYK